MHVDACGYVLSYQALNIAASRGPGSTGTYPVPENPWLWLSGALTYVEPGLEDKVDWADRW
jgi:hypothetical protein